MWDFHVGSSSLGCREGLFLVHFIRAILDVDSFSSLCLCLFSLLPIPFLVPLPTYLCVYLYLCLPPSVSVCIYMCLSVFHLLVRSPVIFTHVTVFLHKLIRIHCFYILWRVWEHLVAMLYFMNFIPKKILHLLFINF